MSCLSRHYIIIVCPDINIILVCPDISRNIIIVYPDISRNIIIVYPNIKPILSLLTLFFLKQPSGGLEVQVCRWHYAHCPVESWDFLASTKLATGAKHATLYIWGPKMVMSVHKTVVSAGTTNLKVVLILKKLRLQVASVVL